MRLAKGRRLVAVAELDHHPRNGVAGPASPPKVSGQEDAGRTEHERVGPPTRIRIQTTGEGPERQHDRHRRDGHGSRGRRRATSRLEDRWFARAVPIATSATITKRSGATDWTGWTCPNTPLR